jgi:hypothetical protein
VARLQARQADHAAYCRIDNRPQLPPSAATENCLAYWADWTYAETQRGLQMVAQRQVGQAIGGILGVLGNAAGAYADHIARTTPQYVPVPMAPIGPQSCQAQPNGAGWAMSCQ